MKLFTVNKDGKLMPYKEQKYETTHQEKDLQDMLENNPEYFFGESKILFIGREVTTNFNSRIDLLGVDKFGNTVVIELKRGRTPRETIAQILEYASFVENLDYDQLNEIWQQYLGEETSLDEYHTEYFDNGKVEQESFNKSMKLVIVAQELSSKIHQVTSYLKKLTVDIHYTEFNYFETDTGKQMISIDFAISEKQFIRPQRVSSASSSSSSVPKKTKEQFIQELDTNGKAVFLPIFDFAKQYNLVVDWGKKGFSLKIKSSLSLVPVFHGYSPSSAYHKQCIYVNHQCITSITSITKKVNNGEAIVQLYQAELQNLEYFNQLKWLIDRPYSDGEIAQFLEVVKKVILKIREHGIKK